MKTDDVRIDAALNKYIWSNGVRNIPRRVRVRISRRKNDDDKAKSPFYSHVQFLSVPSFKGLQTQISKDKK